jgi:hypothetical protein
MEQEDEKSSKSITPRWLVKQQRPPQSNIRYRFFDVFGARGQDNLKENNKPSTIAITP